MSESPPKVKMPLELVLPAALAEELEKAREELGLESHDQLVSYLLVGAREFARKLDCSLADYLDRDAVRIAYGTTRWPVESL